MFEGIVLPFQDAAEGSFSKVQSLSTCKHREQLGDEELCLVSSSRIPGQLVTFFFFFPQQLKALGS